MLSQVSKYTVHTDIHSHPCEIFSHCTTYDTALFFHPVTNFLTFIVLSGEIIGCSYFIMSFLSNALSFHSSIDYYYKNNQEDYIKNNCENCWYCIIWLSNLGNFLSWSWWRYLLPLFFSWRLWYWNSWLNNLL